MSDLVTVKAEPLSWERLPEEPIESHRRFVIYRELGPTRNLKNAKTIYDAKFVAPERDNGAFISIPFRTWNRELREYRWRERACAYDCYMISTHATGAISDTVAAMGKMAKRILEAAETIAPEKWKDLVDGIHALTEILPQVIESIPPHPGHAEVAGPDEPGEPLGQIPN